MTPLADGANLAAAGEVPVAEKLLGSGEIILLAVRPSGWFVVQVSMAVLAVAGLILVGGYAAGAAFHFVVPRELSLFCGLIGVLRLAVGCAQWVSRLYVLTNLRVLRIRGLARVDVFDIPLRKIVQTHLLAGAMERSLGLGSLCFDLTEGDAREGSWVCVARAAEVKQAVDQAIGRTR